MKVSGIICEYNPFHNGHLYHIRETRKNGATHIAAVMSGNFVQRGDVAIMDKLERARLAVRSGADLVIELPVPYCLSSAENFAAGAVHLLDSLGAVDEISFGSECGSVELLSGALSAVEEAAVSRADEIRAIMEKGYTYPRALTSVINGADPAIGAVISEPNNLLAIEYMRALKKTSSEMKPFTVKRVSASHDSSVPEGEYASASYIRERLQEGNGVSAIRAFTTPMWSEAISDAMSRGETAMIERLERVMLYKLRTTTPEEIAAVNDVGQGLEHRIYGARMAGSLEELLFTVKTKRYTMSRIRRIMLSLLIGINRDDLRQLPPYGRILAYNERGREILARAKGSDRIGIDGHIAHKTSDGRTLDQDCSFPTHTEAFMKLVEALTTGDAKVIDSMDEISAVGHRIVQGADVFDKSVLVTDEVIDKIDELRELAPVHNHAHALALRACKSVIPANVPQVVVFDTAFHQTMPPKAFMFGLPYDDYENYHVRKYGFHGTSHRFVSRALADAMGKDVKDLKIVSCHLGNGSSITAVDAGKSVDTSMGFTPLDGVVMGTRTGSVDPSAVTFVADKHHFTPSEMSEYMNKKSGFLGVSGVGSDNRDVQSAANDGNKRAQLVSDMLVYEIRKYIGSYAAAMNGLDAVLFTGGIGENSWEVREGACTDMDYFGIKIDKDLNKSTRGKLMKISTPDSKVEVWIVPTNEELLIARDTLELISK